MLKSTVQNIMAEARAKATDEQNKLNALGRFSEGIDLMRALNQLEQGVQSVIAASPGDSLTPEQVAEIRGLGG